MITIVDTVVLDPDRVQTVSAVQRHSHSLLPADITNPTAFVA